MWTPGVFEICIDSTATILTWYSIGHKFNDTGITPFREGSQGLSIRGLNLINIGGDI